MSSELDRKAFEFGARLGLTFIVQSAGLSAIAVSSLLLYILFSAFKIGAVRTWSTETHVHFYFVNLLFSDLVQAIGGLLSIRWIIDAGVTEGAHCNVQAMFKQAGDVGVALTSLVIAVHTFRVLVFRRSYSPRLAVFVVSAIWVVIAIFIVVGYLNNMSGNYYGNTGYWCWITSEFTAERILLEYLWLWLAAAVNTIVYVFLALVVMGVIIVEEGRISFARRSEHGSIWRNMSNQGGNNNSGAVAMQLLFYPLVYIITVAPVAIVRWMAFSGHRIPFAATAFASCLFSLSGLFNVILFKLTRPKLLPTRRQDNASEAATLTFINKPSDNGKHFSCAGESFACKDSGDVEPCIPIWYLPSLGNHPYGSASPDGSPNAVHEV